MKTKTLFLTVLFMISLLGTATWAGYCSANASNCVANCSASGYTTSCSSGPDTAICEAFDSNGNEISLRYCHCDWWPLCIF